MDLQKFNPFLKNQSSPGNVKPSNPPSGLSTPMSPMPIMPPQDNNENIGNQGSPGFAKLTHRKSVDPFDFDSEDTRSNDLQYDDQLYPPDPSEQANAAPAPFEIKLPEPRKEIDLGIFKDDLASVAITTPDIMSVMPQTMPRAPEPKIPLKGFDLRIPKSDTSPVEPFQTLPPLIENQPDSNSNLDDRSYVGDFELSKVPVKNIQLGLADVLSKLYQLGLTDTQVNAIINAAQHSSDLKIAVDRMVGLAGIALSVMGKSDDMDELMQSLAVSRQNTKAIDKPQGIPSDPELYERLKEIASCQTVIETPLPLNESMSKAEIPGQPILLGKPTSISLWYYNPLPRDKKRVGYSGAMDFLNDVLGNNAETTPQQGLRINEYVAYAYNVNYGAIQEKAYLLTPVAKSYEVRRPTKADETSYRIVQGIVDGMTILDHTKAGRKTIVGQSKQYPYLLTRACAKAKTKIPDVITLENGVGIVPLPKPIYFLEPIYSLAMSSVSLYRTSEPGSHALLDKLMDLRRSIIERSTSILQISSRDPFAGKVTKKKTVNWY